MFGRPQEFPVEGRDLQDMAVEMGPVRQEEVYYFSLEHTTTIFTTIVIIITLTFRGIIVSGANYVVSY